MNKLPSGWELVVLKEYGYFFSGGTPLTNIKEFYKKEIPFITSSELNQKIITKVNKYISKKGYKNSSAKMIKKGDVLLALYGATAGTIAISEIDGAINQAVLCIRFSKKIDNKFFFYWFDLRKDYFVYKYTQGAQTNFNSEIIKKIQIPLPKSLEEQQKIAEILSEVDRNIELTKKIIEKEKRIKKGLMHDLLKYGIDEKGNIRNPKTHKFKDSELGLIPEEWEVRILKKILQIGSGKGYTHLGKGNIPVYGSGGYLCSVNKYLYKGESVCIGRKGTINKPIFLTGKFWTVDTLFYTYDFKNSLPKFIYYLFQKINWLNYNEASGVPSLSKNIIYNIRIPLPKSLEEQQKIAKILSAQDEKIEKLNKKLNKLKKLKKALMQDLLNGKIRVTKLLKDTK